jgi:DNA-binding GntR family transcriptional regulator
MHLSQKAYGKLKRMILSGRFKSDDVLSERSLAALLTVSRVPVREAIKDLEREGLLIIVPRSGIHVRRLTMTEVRELYEVRQAMEGMAAFLCANYRKRDAMKGMRKKLEALAIDSGSSASFDHAAIQKTSSEFHRMLFDLSQNSQLRSVYELIEPKIDLNLRLTAVHGPDRIEQALAEHIEIAKAIERGDAEQAERLTRLHLENGKAARLGILAGLNAGPALSEKPRTSPPGLRASAAARRSKRKSK